MKIKKIMVYFYVILPMFFIGLLQQIQKNVGYEKTEEISMNDDFILLDINASGYRSITKRDLDKKINAFKDESEVIAFLSQGLSQAKLKQNSAYAGFAIEGYHRINENLKLKPGVLSIYSDLLSFIHQFDKSTKILNDLSSYPNYIESSVIRLLNIKLLQGDLHGAEEQCLKTKSFMDYKIFISCQLWLKGMHSQESEQVEKYARKLEVIAETANNTQTNGGARSWFLQMSLDLYLKSGSIGSAQSILSKIFVESKYLKAIDLAPLIQVVDYLMLEVDFELAEKLISRYDLKGDLVVRQAIIAKNNQTRMVSTDNQSLHSSNSTKMIESYILAKDISKYRIVSLWYMLMHDDLEKAVYYSKLNLEEYSTHIDLLLIKKIKQKVNQISGEML